MGTREAKDMEQAQRLLKGTILQGGPVLINLLRQPGWRQMSPWQAGRLAEDSQREAEDAGWGLLGGEAAGEASVFGVE